MTEVPPRDVLRTVGLLTLGEDPSPEAVEEALRELAAKANGSDKLARVTLRECAIEALKDAGVSSPAKRVDAALESVAAVGAGAEEPAQQDDIDTDQIYEDAREILEAEDQLALFRGSVRRLGFAGDTSAPELVHVALASRSLPRPLGLAIRGPSAAGKTYTVNTTAAHHPESTVHDVSAMSERYLAYADFPTEHRYVSISEASALHRDGVGATIIRELAWSRVLRYGTVVRTEDGPQAITIEKPGPTGLITTSTKPLDPEIATRLIEVWVTDSPAQTRAVLEALARGAEGGATPVPDQLRPWHAASRWLELEGEKQVVVPFASAIAEGVPTESVRMRRDFEQVLTVVKALAFMHQQTRSRDGGARIVATLDDYATAHRLLAKTLSITLDRVSDETRETVEAVAEFNEGLEPSKQGVSYHRLAEALGLSKSGAWRRAKVALKEGFLANAEERRGYPAKLIVGDPLPPDRAVLPSPEEVSLHTPLDTPPESTQRINASDESPAIPGESSVESGVEPEEVLTQHPDPLNTSLNTRSPRNDTEKSVGIESLRENEGGAGEGVAVPELFDALED